MPDVAKQLRLLFLTGGILGVLLLSGCVPTIFSYHYISLENYPKARVIERAQATPGEYQIFSGEIPTRYEIVRQAYALALEVCPNNMEPIIEVQVIAPPAYHLGLHQSGTATGETCNTWSKQRQSKWWVYDFHQCSGNSPWKRVEQQLRFSVLDQHGDTVGQEAIPYTVKRDGFYGYIDAI